MNKFEDMDLKNIKGDKIEISWKDIDMGKIDLEYELEKTEVIIDIEKIIKSNIKQIIIPLHRFVEWKCVDLNGKFLSKSELFNSCLNKKHSKKAKQLHKIYMTQIWNLLDDEVKKDMNFDDFVS